MSLAKLTSVSTQTLSLLLERQRLQTLPTANNAAATHGLHLPQITKNLGTLRSGILEMEAREGRIESVRLLRGQYERMRTMLNGVVDVDSLDVVEERAPTPPPHSPPPPKPIRDADEQYSPYMDDPEAGNGTSYALRQQQLMMTDQDDRLDELSRSIGRQHHISLQINDELDVHTGLLEQMDTDLDRTESRLTGARRKLDRFAKGARENCSAMTIAILIFVLLILVIIFKT